MNSPRAIEPGTVLQGTYEIVRRIGVGGMGEVHEARHTRLPGRFAVKVLSAQVEGTGADFLRFRREAEIASSLRHPHIVQVVDFNQMADGAPYIVMEYLDGVDLAAEIARVGRLSPERTAIIVSQIAAALAAAHAGGIVHRDLKPQNVLVSRLRDAGGDFVKVVDFGISKVRTAATLTDDAKMLGTPQYMAPEQARGRSDDVDGRTDQFALAVMAYELLTGRKPFVGENVPAVLFSITNEATPPMPELPAAIRPAVETVLRRATGKQKDERFATILEFSDALAAAIAGRPVELPPESGQGTRRPGADASAPTVKAPDKRPAAPVAGSPTHARRSVLLMGGALVLAVLGVGVKVLSGRSPSEPATPTVAVPTASLPAATAAPTPAAPVPAAPAPAAVNPAAPAPPAAPPVAESPPQAHVNAAVERSDTSVPGASDRKPSSVSQARRAAQARVRTPQRAPTGEDDHAAKAAPRPGAFIEDL